MGTYQAFAESLQRNVTSPCFISLPRADIWADIVRVWNNSVTIYPYPPTEKDKQKKGSVLTEKGIVIFSSMDIIRSEYKNFPPKIPPSSISYTKESLYSVTNTRINKMFLERLSEFLPPTTIFYDATSNVGGDLINTIFNWNELSQGKDPILKSKLDWVIGTEIDNITFDYLKENVILFNRYYPNITRKIDLFNKDCIVFINDSLTEVKPNVVLFDPPWGGGDYKTKKEVELYLGQTTVWEAVNLVFEKWNSEIVVVKSPINYAKNKGWKEIESLLVSEFDIPTAKSKVHYLVFRGSKKEEIYKYPDISKETSVGEFIDAILKADQSSDEYIKIKILPGILPVITFGPVNNPGRRFIRFITNSDKKETLKNLIKLAIVLNTELHISWSNESNTIYIYIDVLYTSEEDLNRVAGLLALQCQSSSQRSDHINIYPVIVRNKGKEISCLSTVYYRIKNPINDVVPITLPENKDKILSILPSESFSSLLLSKQLSHL